MNKKILLFFLMFFSWVMTLMAQSYRIGDIYTLPNGSSGIIYYINSNGVGWVVALTDASTGCAWGTTTDVPALINLNPFYYQDLLTDTAGYTNTQIIRMYQNVNTGYAAGVVDFENGWVLPSPAQLRMLYGQLPFISTSIINAGGTSMSNDWYWCSAEFSETNSWRIDFGINDYSGGSFNNTSKTSICHVRAVHSFTTARMGYDTSLTYLWNTGSTYPYINVSPTQTTTYTVTATTDYGCSNTAEQTIIVGTGTSQTIYDTVCQGTNYEANGFSLSEMETRILGTLTRSRMLTTDECISSLTLQLYISPTDSMGLSQEVCNSYEWNGVTYYESGDYTQYFNKRNGCDSVVTLHLTVNHDNTSDTIATVCNSFSWYEYNNISGSGTFRHTFTNDAGCDSVVSLHLTVRYSTYNVFDTTVCEYYEWMGETYNVTSTYTYDYINADGCPSADTLHLIVRSNTHNSFDTTVCDSYEWHDVIYTTSGTFTHNYNNVNGCPSTDTLHLIVRYNTSNVFDTTVCESYTWHGVTYTSSGTYTYNYNNVGGCVSTDTLHLTVNIPLHESETVSAYDTYIWHGETYNQSGNYIYNHTDANGCNQADTLHLTIHYSFSGEFSVVSCDSYTWNDSTYTTSGDYVQRFQDINGADSIMTLHLAIYHGTHNILDTSVCESYTWIDGNGETYSTSGIYIFEYTNTNGCASADTLHLTINPVYEISFEDIICEGFAYNNHGFNIPSTQTAGVTNLNMTQNLQSQSECDSIVTLHLTIVDTSIAINSLTSDFCEEYYAELSVETNIMNYMWSTGETSQTIIVTQPGIYTVTAAQGNCSVSAWYQIETCELNIYLPNTITPGNEDGLNDYFGLHDKYKAMIEEFEIRIYSRWGELVYYSNDKDFKWYGEYHGRINQNVIYTYLINFTDSRGVPYQLTGSITVL